MIRNNNPNNPGGNGNSEDVFGYDSPSGSPVSQSSLFEIAWRSRWIILLCVILTMAAGFVYISKATPVFTSTSRVYVEQSGPRILNDVQGVMTQSKNYLYTQAELMKSTSILSATIDIPEIERMKSFDDVDNLMAFLKKKVGVSVGKKDDIINVSFDSAYPAEAAHLVNTIVDSYITYHSSRKKTTSAEVLRILQKEQGKRHIELSGKLEAMMNFKRENEALAYENRSGNIILDRLSNLSQAVTESQLALIESKSLFEIARGMVTDPEKRRQFVEAERSKRIYFSAGDERTRLTAEL